VLSLSNARLRVRLLGNPWLSIAGDDACLVRLIRANRPRPLSEPEAVRSLAGSVKDIAQVLSLSGPLAAIILREPRTNVNGSGAIFFYHLHPDVRFEAPPALVPGTTIPHEEMGGQLEPDALDRFTAEIHGIAFGEAL